MSKRLPSRRRPVWPWVVATLGYFLPGLVGLGIWRYLKLTDTTGIKPLPSADVVGAVPVVAVVSLVWALPFVAVAVLARVVALEEGWRYRALVTGAFLGTAVGAIVVFSGAWKTAAEAIMFFFMWPGPVFGFTLLGGFAGFAIGWVADRWSA
jgi:hypothetical protein